MIWPMWVHWALVGCLHDWVYCSKETQSDLHIVYIALWEMNDEENKQIRCAAGGITPKNGSQSTRRCQHKRRVCFLSARQILYDLQERKIKLLIHLSQRQSLPATRRGRTRILWLGMPARFKEWEEKKRLTQQDGVTLTFCVFAFPSLCS